MNKKLKTTRFKIFDVRCRLIKGYRCPLKEKSKGCLPHNPLHKLHSKMEVVLKLVSHKLVSHKLVVQIVPGIEGDPKDNWSFFNYFTLQIV